MTKPFGLPKAEKLKSRKEIDALFSGKRRFSVYPLQVWYSIEKGSASNGVQIGVTCSKRRFKRAIDRNRVKRLIREAYRLQKAILADGMKEEQHVQLFFVYLDKSLPDYATIFVAMTTCLTTLKNKFSNEQAN